MSASRRPLSRGLVVGLVLGALAAGAGAAPAAADSLAYIKDNNVWLAQPDGSGAYQVTLDGTAAAPYESPSQSDGGVVVAVRAAPGRRRQIYRMTQSGGLLNAPIDTPAPGTGALNPKVSPNGALVAYWFVTGVSDPPCPFCISAANRALISHSDRFTGAAEVGTPNGGGWPSWLNDSTITVNDGAPTQWYYTLGMPEMAAWFTDALFTNGGPLSFLDAEVSPGGDRMALVRGDFQEEIRFLTLNGPPPATPTPVLGCGYANPNGKFADPTWASDGRRLAFADGDGIWLADVAGLSCPLPDPALVVPGGHDPDLSPAALSPGARPGCGNPGNPAACPAQTTTPPAGTPAPTTPAQSPSVPAVTLGARLDAALAAGARTLGLRRIAGLLRARRLTVAFDAPAAGTLTARLSTRGAHALTLAAGRHVFTAPGKASVVLALTSKGRKRLRHARRVAATLVLAFTPAAGGRPTTVSRSVSLKR